MRWRKHSRLFNLFSARIRFHNLPDFLGREDMDSINITLIGGWIVSILLAYITAYFKTRSEFEKEHARLRLDVIMKQKHEYFFPFKYCADEFRRRIIHIQKILNREYFDNDKYENMIKRLKQNFNSKDLEWFFNDEIGSQGGYFITSTIYQNCMLFYWMKRIQSEQPFIPLDLGKSSREMLKSYDTHCKEDRLLSPIDEGRCDVYDIIKNIKIAISRNKGIPYGLHDSIGDFLFDYSNGRVINYEEFCEQLRDDRKRVKFFPVLNFWTGLVINENEVDENRLKKLGAVIVILELLKNADIKERLK